MSQSKRCIAVVCAAIALWFLWAPYALANSAEPPNLRVYVRGNGAKDAVVTAVLSDGREVLPNTTWKAWERSDAFYQIGTDGAHPVALRVNVGGDVREYSVEDAMLDRYNNYATLNVDRQTLTSGRSAVRDIALIALRLFLTLLIEGGVFWLFGYRKKRSWLMFLIVNLVTQGLLNIALSGSTAPPSYAIFGLIAAEFVVFTAEMIALPLLIKEHRRRRAVLFALAANLASLIAGGAMIAYLPI